MYSMVHTRICTVYCAQNGLLSTAQTTRYMPHKSFLSVESQTGHTTGLDGNLEWVLGGLPRAHTDTCTVR